MDPFLRIHFNPSCCGCDSDKQHAIPFSGAGLMTGFSVFLNKESPVTQICLFLIEVCIFSPFPSALPSVCRFFSLLFPSSHRVFCTLASFLLRLLSRHCFVFWGFLGGQGFLFFFFTCVLPFFLSTIIFLLILQQISSALFLSFFPYHRILPTFPQLSSHPGNCLPQKSSNFW